MPQVGIVNSTLAPPERRRGRRVALEVPLLMRRGSGNAPLIELATKNISLAGVYVEAEEGQVPAVNEIVVTTISIPEEERRAFPFARLVGRSRVVRVKPLPSSQNTSSKKRYGIALEFGSDMTALSGIPPRG